MKLLGAGSGRSRMEAKRDFSDGTVVIKATCEEAALISEGLYAVLDADVRLSGKDAIDECDREDMRREASKLDGMRAAIDEALRDKGLELA